MSSVDAIKILQLSPAAPPNLLSEDTTIGLISSSSATNAAADDAAEEAAITLSDTSGTAPPNDNDALAPAATRQQNAEGGERAKLNAKIDKCRDALTRNSIEREHDVEEFLKITSRRPDNPQIARIKHHFEKKNKKHAQESERLQKKLDDYERRLAELLEESCCSESLHNNNDGNGSCSINLSVSPSAAALNQSSTSGRFLHSVGHGIRRTVHAPLGIAQKMRKNVFGSADELRQHNVVQRRGPTPPSPPPVASGSVSVGKSTFYDPGGCADNSDSPAIASSSAKTAGAGVEIEFGEEAGLLARRGENEPQRALRLRCSTLQHAFNTFKNETEAELRSQENEIVNSRFRIQHLEQTINETMELHQNEIRQLKNDLSMISVRMDYQYNDRFKKVEEAIEQAENKVVRVETSWRESESSAAVLERRRAPWNTLMFSGANIVVELLKIALYLTAVALDSTTALLNSLGFSGTRKRAGVVLIIGLVLFLFWGHLQPLLMSMFHSTSSSPTNSSSNSSSEKEDS